MKKITAALSLTLSFFVLSSSLIKAQPTSFVNHGISGGGANYSPSINPANSQEIYSTTDMTDLYHTTNGGANWSVVNWTQITGGAQAQVAFTNNNKIRYCLNSDEMSESYIPSITNDGGNTWNEVTDPSAGNGCWYLFTNPASSTQLFVTDYSNIYMSTNSGTTFGSAFYTDGTGNGAYIAGYFFDGANMYICTQAGILVSTNSGTTWSALTDAVTSEDIISFAGVKNGSTTRFYCVTQTAGNAYPGTTGENASNYANVYMMNYPGTWTKIETGITAGDWPMYVVTGNNMNEAFLGGESGSGDPIILKTSNSGALWKYVFNTSGNQNIQTGYCGQGGDLGWSWPQYVFGLAMSPNDSLTVVETDEGFMHKTSDGGKTWQACYVPPSELNPDNASTPKGKYYKTTGIEMTSTWDLMWYDSVHVFGGFTDVTGVRSNDGGNTWGFDCSGLYSYNTTYKFLKNPTNGVIYAATSSIHDMYQSTHLTDAQIDGGTGAVMYSTDTGKTFNTMYNFGKPVIWLALDPTNSNRMYAAVINHKGSGNAGGIWISNNINLNAGATWTHCTNPSRTQGHPLNIRVLNDGTLVATFSGRRNATNFTDSSGVFISTNQGTSWTDVSVNGMKYWTMEVNIDPNDATQNTWYCCVYSGYGGPANGQGGLYRTINRGTSWTKIINQSMANVGDTSSCFSVSFDPMNKGAAYLTTETGGLFYTKNIEATNPVFNLVASYPFHQPTRVFFNPYNQNDVWVTSFGNGLEYGTEAPTSINELTSDNAQCKVYPNPSNGTFNFVIARSEATKPVRTASWPGGQSQVLIYNAIGQQVYSSSLTIVNSPLSIDLSNQVTGIYLYRVIDETGKCIGSGKLIKE